MKRFAVVLPLLFLLVQSAQGNYALKFHPTMQQLQSGYHQSCDLSADAGQYSLKRTESWTSPDKFDHLLGSAMLSGCAYLALSVAGKDEEQSAAVSAGTVICLGALKEIYDMHNPGGQASWRDLTMDVFGTVLGVLVVRSLLK